MYVVMATNMTKEEDNFLRIVYLNYRVGTTALRRYFDSVHPNLQSDLSSPSNKAILSDLHKPPRGQRKILYQEQWNTLYPASGSPVVSSADLDVTLMVCLLRNLPPYVSPPASGFDALPLSNDLSHGAHIARIKYYKNFIVSHSKDGKLSDTVCNRIWIDLEMAIHGLGNQQDVKDASDAKSKFLDYNALNELVNVTFSIRRNLERLNVYGNELAVQSSKIKKLESAVENMEKEKEEHSDLKEKILKMETEQDEIIPKNIRVHSLHTELDTHGSIPAIILRMDKESIRIYMKALESGSEIKHDIRVIIVGKKGAGKTSLVRNLLKEKLDNVDSTNGIDIHVKRCKIRTADGKWVFQEGSFISDVSQRMLRSMITQTRLDDSPDNKEKNECKTANQCKDTLKLNKVNTNVSVDEATDYLQNRDTQELTKLDASANTKGIINALDKQHDMDLREIIDSAKDMDDEEYASLSLWDFAGDREFYNTHQTFLSEEAIYLVVTKLNETDDETNETLKFWFDSIHFYGSSDNVKHEDIEHVNRTDLEPPIIAIGTHKDQCMGNFKDQLVEQIRYNLGNSAARQHLRVCHYISNKTDEDTIFEKLRHNIYEIGKSRPGFGKLLPVRFIQLEKSLERKLQTGTQFISFNDVKSLAEKIGAITDTPELDVFLRYHHGFGNLIYFKDIPEFIILNPQWLVNVFRLLVTADEFRDKLIGHTEWDMYEITGKLTESLLSCIFANQTDDITTCKEHILKIMEKFDIIVRPRMLIDGKEQVDPHYYVPCMIKTIASRQIQDQLTPKQKSYCLCLQFNFLPPVFINHLIISFIRRYPTSQFREGSKNSRPALFRHTGLFDIKCCEKLLVASFKNFIQFQVWKYDCECHTSSKNIGNFILKQVDTIIHESYQLLRINYEVKMKCEFTSYDCFKGILDPIDNGQGYFCYEHNRTHTFRNDWFSEHTSTKRAAECQTDQENTIDQKKDRDQLCIEIHVQKKMKKETSSVVEMNMAKMVKVALNVLADVLFDLLKLETYGDSTYLLCPRSQCDITFLYKEHRRINKHIPSNSSKKKNPWGGTWQDIAVTDTKLGDDIERIRLTRNELQHKKLFALDNTRYIALCTMLQDVLNRFDKHINPSHLYTDRLNDILDDTFEREDVECVKLEIKSKL